MIYKMISVTEGRYLINLELTIYFVEQLLCKILTGLENRPVTSIRFGRKIFNRDNFFVG